MIAIDNAKDLPSEYSTNLSRLLDSQLLNILLYDHPVKQGRQYISMKDFLERMAIIRRGDYNRLRVQ